jgi:hypothetical protein
MVTIMSGRECMTRSEGRQRERASAAEYRPRLKIGRIEALPADGDGPVDHARKPWHTRASNATKPAPAR